MTITTDTTVTTNPVLDGFTHDLAILTAVHGERMNADRIACTVFDVLYRATAHSENPSAIAAILTAIAEGLDATSMRVSRHGSWHYTASAERANAEQEDHYGTALDMQEYGCGVSAATDAIRHLARGGDTADTHRHAHTVAVIAAAHTISTDDAHRRLRDGVLAWLTLHTDNVFPDTYPDSPVGEYPTFDPTGHRAATDLAALLRGTVAA